MCGIVCVFGVLESELKEKKSAVEQGLSLLTHRGPDDSEVLTINGAKQFSLLGHTRLSIVDVKTGHQPFSEEGISWVHNGEIYNHKDLIKEYRLSEKCTFSSSDSAVIGPLYQKLGVEAFDLLDGVFSIVIIDGDQVVAARDPLGVKPLFYGTDQSGAMWFSSEIKALEESCKEIKTFPPGHYYTSLEGFVRYYTPKYETQTPFLKEQEEVFSKLRDTLTKATKKRLMADVPLGSLLSGGLDSSLVAAIAARELRKEGKVLKTFSVGLDPDTDDLKKAREVSEHIGSDHHEVIFTIEEGLTALSQMVKTLETFDITTIRASTPMYLMSKYIRDQGIKVVLSGEGADEIFGGYLYFSHAPSAEEFHSECLRRISLLHTADLLRADRSTMGASVEARVPFLDKEFLEVSMAIDPELKVIKGDRAEKWVLREAFAKEDLIPKSILWRQKEQFSDGVGYSWVDELKALAEKVVLQERFDRRAELYPYHTPTTKEAFMYRELYAQVFTHPDSEKQVQRWIPRWQDYDCDPSGRANKGHKATYIQKEVSI